jgi:hypothetical protein
MVYFRYCVELINGKECGRKFWPKSKYQVKCDECLENIRKRNYIKMICSLNKVPCVNLSINSLNFIKMSNFKKDIKLKKMENIS